MNITVISVGKIKEKYFTAAIDEYSKRLSRFAKLNIIEVADEKIPDNASEKEMEQIKEARANAYRATEWVDFANKYMRHDIGKAIDEADV